jgi:DNA (cytosine-5)-methyltransferase 1
MSHWAVYNEIDEEARAGLAELMRQGFIMPGAIDGRSIKEVQPDDYKGFTQVHLFAGIGVWSHAARLAGWPDSRPLWSGSCPCQPFSAAGKRGGGDDPRHLWPDMLRLARPFRPPVIVGEQVAGSLGYGWLDGVQSDLAAENYASRAVDIAACGFDAPHIRNRLAWIAERMADTNGGERDGRSIEQERRPEGRGPDRGADAGGEALVDAQSERRGKRRTEAGVQRGRSAAPGPDVRELALNVGHTESRVGGTGLRQDGSFFDWPLSADANVSDGEAVGDAERAGLEGHAGHGDGDGGRSVEAGPAAPPNGRNGTFWSDAEWLICHDGKARRAQPGIRLLAHGAGAGILSDGGRGDSAAAYIESLAKEAGVKSPSLRIPLWKTAGNSIVAPLFAEVLAAYLDTEGVTP